MSWNNATQEEKDYVLRKAMLLGFSAEEYKAQLPSITSSAGLTYGLRWKLKFDGLDRVAYATVHDAALDFLRLMNLPHCSGDRGHGQD